MCKNLYWFWPYLYPDLLRWLIKWFAVKTACKMCCFMCETFHVLSLRKISDHRIAFWRAKTNKAQAVQT